MQHELDTFNRDREQSVQVREHSVGDETIGDETIGDETVNNGERTVETGAVVSTLLAQLEQTPKNSFNWSPEQWETATQAMGKLVRDASTQWQERRFTPTLEAEEIRHLFNQPLPEQGTSIDQLLDVMQTLVQCSGYNGHPKWLAYITSSPDPVGVLGAFFTAAINQNNNLWRIAPGATSIELQCIEWFKSMLDLDACWEGIFSSGGQMANIIACAVARQVRSPWDVRRHGIAGPSGSGRLKLYASDQAHYCHHQAAELLGMGSEALRIVPSDADYRMRVDILAEMIAEDRQQGHIPIAVLATAGTVATGAIDPIVSLRELTDEAGLWLHVDGAYGLPAYVVPDVAPQFEGIQQADSLSFDPHKWLYSPLDAGVTLVRHPGTLRQTFGFQVSYLDQVVAEQSRVDLVDFTPENSRPARATKVWLAILAHGLAGFRSQIGRDMQLIKYMAALIEATPGLVLAAGPSLSIVCWRVEPSSLLGNQDLLNQLQTRVIEVLEQRGLAFLSKAQLHDGQIALRACVVNFRTSAAEIEAAVTASAMVGLELSVGMSL